MHSSDAGQETLASSGELTAPQSPALLATRAPAAEGGVAPLRRCCAALALFAGPRQPANTNPTTITVRMAARLGTGCRDDRMTSRLPQWAFACTPDGPPTV